MRKKIVALSMVLAILLSGLGTMLSTYAEEVDLKEQENAETSADGWKVLNKYFTMENTFIRNGIRYKIVSTITSSKIDEANVIYNLDNGKSYTYCYSDGNGMSSGFYYLDGPLYASLHYDEVYYRLGKQDGKNYAQKKIIDNDKGLEVIITTRITDNGEIQHNYDVTNIGTKVLQKTSFMVMLDTELNGNDHIDLYSDGNNGVYMSIEDFSLYVEPAEGTTKLFVGKWALNSYKDIDEEGRVVSGYGRTVGQLLITGVDSAVYVGLDVESLDVGKSISFAYEERIMTSIEERPIPNYMIRVQHIDQDRVILDEEFIAGEEGSAYSVAAKEYEGYELYNDVGETAGTFSQDGIAVIFYYNRPSVECNIIVKHVAEDGTILLEETVNGKEGTNYNLEAKEFASYELKRVDGEQIGTFSQNGTTVIFHYEDSREEYSIVVKHVAEDGTILLEETVNGKEGINYNAEAKEFASYELKRIDGEVTGVYQESGDDLIFHYKAVVENPTVVAINTPKTMSTNPATGDSTMIMPMIFAFSVSFFALAMIAAKKREHR